MQYVTITPCPSRPLATITAPTGIKALAQKVGVPVKTSGGMSKQKRIALTRIVGKVAGERKPRESASAYCQRAEAGLRQLIL
tara:strand:+ start:857 stop:1102 length:246 start_codon:yes stop_codon:yes gene_type:complete